MPKISQAAVDEYVKKSGRTCPWCKIGNVHNFSESDAIKDYIAQPVKCDNPACGKRWWDIYTLTDIHEDAYNEK
jgi:hypothetical protein